MSKFNSVIKFSKFVVTEQVFYKTEFTYALVNLKPIVPGHVLIVPLRNVPRLKDLTPEESQDFMETLQKVHKFILHVFKADSLNIAIQDGPEAGQSVPHLHAHIIPRTRENNIGDKIYEKLISPEFDIDDSLRDFYKRKQQAKEKKEFVKPDDQRSYRADKEMYNEAQWLASELKKFYCE